MYKIANNAQTMSIDTRTWYLALNDILYMKFFLITLLSIWGTARWRVRSGKS